MIAAFTYQVILLFKKKCRLRFQLLEPVVCTMLQKKGFFPNLFVFGIKKTSGGS